MILPQSIVKRTLIFFHCIFLYGICASTCFAQSVVELTLDDALDRIGDQNEELRIAIAGIRRAEAQEEIARSAYWPQINASVNYTKTFISQYEVNSDNSGRQQDTSEPAFDFSALFGDLPFGREDVWTLGLTASQPIYMGGRITASVRAAEAREESSRIELTTQQAQMLLSVTQAYYDALLADQLVQLSRESIEQSRDALRDIELQFQEGQRPEFEVLRARVGVDNQVPALVERVNNRQLANLRLKQLLNLPMTDSIVFVNSVMDSSARFGTPADSSANVRAPVRQSVYNREALREQIQIARSEGLPQVSLSTRYAPVAFELFPAVDRWRADWIVSLNVSMPLFTGGRISGSIDAAEATAEESNARLSQAREAASLDAQATYNEYYVSIAALQAALGAGELAERTLELAQIRYKEGISTLLEVSDARLQRNVAVSNEARAHRNYQVARAKLALLNNLPLGFAVTGIGGTSQVATQGSAIDSQMPTQSAQPATTSPLGQ